MYDAFRLFDKYNLGYLNQYDLNDELNKLGIFGPQSEINLFFKRYDLNSDGRIRFSEFAEAFSPKDKIYSDHLNNKRSNYSAKTPEEAFSSITRMEFADMIRKMLRAEG